MVDPPLVVVALAVFCARCSARAASGREKRIEMDGAERCVSSKSPSQKRTLSRGERHPLSAHTACASEVGCAACPRSIHGMSRSMTAALSSVSTAWRAAIAAAGCPCSAAKRPPWLARAAA